MKVRKRMRLKGFDYSSQNFYFVTICVLNKQKIFGKIESGNVILNKKGEIVKECFINITEHFTNVELDEFIIMPNHFHAIIIITGPAGLRSPQPTVETEPIITTQKINETQQIDKTQPNVKTNQIPKTKHFTLSQIIAYFKYQSTKQINEAFHCEGEKIWQRSFHDKIIRNENELHNVRKYIRNNAYSINAAGSR